MMTTGGPSSLTAMTLPFYGENSEARRKVLLSRNCEDFEMEIADAKLIRAIRQRCFEANGLPVVFDKLGENVAAYVKHINLSPASTPDKAGGFYEPTVVESAELVSKNQQLQDDKDTLIRQLQAIKTHSVRLRRVSSQQLDSSTIFEQQQTTNNSEVSGIWKSLKADLKLLHSPLAWAFLTSFFVVGAVMGHVL